MDSDFLKTAKKTVNYWWLSLIIGVLFIGVGIFCFFYPLDALISFTILFIVSFFIAGFSEIAFALANKNTYDNWGWSLVNGIIDLALGVLLILIPINAPIIMIYFIGFWIMFQSFWGVGASFDLKRIGVKGWGGLLALAACGVIFSFMFIVNPEIGGSFIVAIGAISFIIYGLFRMALSYKLKTIKDTIEK